MNKDIITRPAQLPQTYEQMSYAIAACESVDECKEWADKAAALASYARQSEDKELMNKFMRIRARAIRRAGEVLESIEPSKGGRPPETSTAADTSYSRTQAAEDAGMSKRQQVTAMKLARIPQADFEVMVEAYDAPTITFLANPHVLHNSGENEWYTPPEFIAAAREVMGSIDLDPASCEVAQRNVKAGRYFTVMDNGLSQFWEGNIWMNPPYGKDLIGLFVDKLIGSLPDIKAACVLVNNATDTRWMQSLMEKCDSVCFISGRIKYLDETGYPANAPLQGQAVLYFGPDKRRFSDIFYGFGRVFFRA